MENEPFDKAPVTPLSSSQNRRQSRRDERRTQGHSSAGEFWPEPDAPCDCHDDESGALLVAESAPEASETIGELVDAAPEATEAVGDVLEAAGDLASGAVEVIGGVIEGVLS